MKRYKTLLFQSYQFFRDWYIHMKKSFEALVVCYIKTDSQRIRVMISY